MAKGASKRIAAQNASSLKVLLWGFLASNACQLLAIFLLTSTARRHSPAFKWDVAKYVSTELVAAGLGLVMRDMAKRGDDLNAEGLTALMWDVIFVTWAVHVGSALIWRRLWWLYALIPLYAIFLLYTKLLVPFVFGGRDPLSSILGAFGESRSAPATAANPAANAGADADPGLSKRQKKLQARADKGDPRVQRREVRRGA